MILSIENVTEFVELITKIVALIVLMGGTLWTYNKLYMSKTYVPQKEYKEEMLALTKEIHKTNDRLNTMEKEQAVFREEYKGDMKAINIQLNQISDIVKDIVHEVNNIPPVKVKDLFEILFEDKMKEKH